MNKTAGSILAEILLAEKNGASKKELKKKEIELVEQIKEQLGNPLTEVIVSVKIFE